MADNTTVLALTGPPASGKSTVVDILTDIGVPCKDTGDAVREEAHRRYDGTGGPDEDCVWEIAGVIREEHGPAGPTIIAEDWIETQCARKSLICIASIREQEEAEWLRDNVGPTLVAKVEAPAHDREQRYVDMKIEESGGTFSKQKISDIKQELYERELRESPYPDHEVVIDNHDGVRTRNLWDRLDKLVTVLD